MISERKVARALSHDRSLAIFDLIARAEQDGRGIIDTLNLTRKQYYSRISVLTQCDLVEKINGKYYLTSFGKVVYESQRLIGVGIKDFWKLKAIDIFRLKLSPQECNKIIETLIENKQLRKLIFTKDSLGTKRSPQENNTLLR
jgi:hypothetical protein